MCDTTQIGLFNFIMIAISYVISIGFFLGSNEYVAHNVILW